MFAFIHSFDEIVITSLVNGLSIHTMPLKMFQNMCNEIDPTIAVFLSVIWLVVLYFTWWRSRPRAQGAFPGMAP